MIRHVALLFILLATASTAGEKFRVSSVTDKNRAELLKIFEAAKQQDRNRQAAPITFSIISKVAPKR